MKPIPAPVYSGKSMAPLFRPGDGLRVEAVAFDQVRPGDVVIYREPDAGKLDSGPMPPEVAVSRELIDALWPPRAVPADRRIVHRVVAVFPAGLQTRGDSNLLPDEELVPLDRFEGRVKALERGGRIRRVLGGRLGLMSAALSRLRLRMRRGVLVVAGYPYGLLRKTGFARRIWRPSLRTMRLSTPGGPLIKTIHGSRTVVRWWPSQGRFECRKPYDLVVERPNTSASFPVECVEGGQKPPHT